MFSTDFIFRQQENLVDNQKCQAGFRLLRNKIPFFYDLSSFARLFSLSLHNKTASIFMETRERVGMSKKMINDLILTHFSIIWPNTTVLRKTKTRKLNQPGGNCKFFHRVNRIQQKKIIMKPIFCLLIKKLALNLSFNLCRDKKITSL